jgi:hypothetical protein
MVRGGGGVAAPAVVGIDVKSSEIAPATAHGTTRPLRI